MSLKVRVQVPLGLRTFGNNKATASPAAEAWKFVTRTIGEVPGIKIQLNEFPEAGKSPAMALQGILPWVRSPMPRSGKVTAAPENSSSRKLLASITVVVVVEASRAEGKVNEAERTESWPASAG